MKKKMIYGMLVFGMICSMCLSSIQADAEDADESVKIFDDGVYVSSSVADPLSKDDYTISGTQAEVMKEEYSEYNFIDNVFDLFESADEGNHGYCIYYLDPDEIKEDIVITARGVILGSDLEDVVKDYGTGKEYSFTDQDVIYVSFSESDPTLSLVMKSQCSTYIAYDYEDLGQIVFYFDDDKLVSWIAFTDYLYAETYFRDTQTISQVQQALNDAGYECGTPDGVAGGRTEEAIRQYQNDHGLTASGSIDEELVTSLGLLNGLAPAPESSPEEDRESETEAVAEAEDIKETEEAEVLETEGETPTNENEDIAESAETDAEPGEEVAGDPVIENDNFRMTFESVEVYDDGTIWLSDTSNISTTLAEGCKRYALKTEFENFSSTAIDHPSMTFNISLLINGEYSYASSSTGIIVPSFTLDPLCDEEIYIYADIPENALDILDTAVFTIAFNDDLSSVIPVTDTSGETTVEADNFYTVNCTSSAVQSVQSSQGETATETAESMETEQGQTDTDAVSDENVTAEETEGEPDASDVIEIGLNDVIENDNFRMTFESVEVYEDDTIWLSDTSKISTSLAEGCKRYALKTEFENLSATAIDNPGMAFNISLLINGEYSYASSSTGIIVPSFTLDPLCDEEIYIYADIPENALDILDTAVFTIAFNDDLSWVIPVTDTSGETTVEADNFYAVNCTSSTNQTSQSGEEESGSDGNGSGNDEWQVLYDNYGDVIDLLEEETWFYNGGSDTLLNGITFKEDTATIQQILFDGNGDHDNGSSDCAYTLDDNMISVTQEDGETLEIPYAVDGETVTLGNGEYYTTEEVFDGLQGSWTYSTNTFGLEYEYNLQISGDTYEVESANEGVGLASGEYYYSGPYSGTFTVGFGSLDFGSTVGECYKWSFNIIDGEVIPLHYDHVCSRGSGLKGQSGYTF